MCSKDFQRPPLHAFDDLQRSSKIIFDTPLLLRSKAAGRFYSPVNALSDLLIHFYFCQRLGLKCLIKLVCDFALCFLSLASITGSYTENEPNSANCLTSLGILFHKFAILLK